MTPAGETISYADLVALSGRFANVLVARGVKPGDRVAVQVEKSVPALVLYLATVRAGAVYLPLNTAYTLAELEYFIGDAEPSLVVCDPAKRAGSSSSPRRSERPSKRSMREGRARSRMPQPDAAEAFATVRAGWR